MGVGFFCTPGIRIQNRNMPVAYCCHQFKNWWLPLFSPRENANESPVGSPHNQHSFGYLLFCTPEIRTF